MTIHVYGKGFTVQALQETFVLTCEVFDVIVFGSAYNNMITVYQIFESFDLSLTLWSLCLSRLLSSDSSP